jgi:hypothetical protein
MKLLVRAAVALAVSVAVPAYAQVPASGALDDLGYFDLGFSLSALPRDSAGAKKWLAAQPADTQRVILAACDNYVKHPIAVDMAETVVFCQALLAK